jgi:hypothetical protein
MWHMEMGAKLVWIEKRVWEASAALEIKEKVVDTIVDFHELPVVSKMSHKNKKQILKLFEDIIKRAEIIEKQANDHIDRVVKSLNTTKSV